MTNGPSDHLDRPGTHRFTRAPAYVAGAAAAAFAVTKAAAWALTAGGALLMSPIVAAMARTPPVSATTGDHEPAADIVSVTDDYRRAVLAGDPRAVARVYREDGTELPPCRAPVRGRAAIEQRYRDLFTAYGRITSFTFTHIQSAVDGALAYDVATYQQRLSLRSGNTVGDEGKYLVVLRRTDGAWKAAYAIYSSDTTFTPSHAASPAPSCPASPRS